MALEVKCVGTAGAASWGRCEKKPGHFPPCTHDPEPRRIESEAPNLWREAHYMLCELGVFSPVRHKKLVKMLEAYPRLRTSEAVHPVPGTVEAEARRLGITPQRPKDPLPEPIRTKVRACIDKLRADYFKNPERAMATTNDCACGEDYMTQAEECSGCRERDDAEQRTNEALSLPPDCLNCRGWKDEPHTGRRGCAQREEASRQETYTYPPCGVSKCKGTIRTMTQDRARKCGDCLEKKA